MCVLNVDPTHVVSERLGVSVIATSSLILSSLLKFVCKPLYQQLSLPVFILFVIALLFLLCIFKVGNLNRSVMIVLIVCMVTFLMSTWNQFREYHNSG